MRDAPQRASPPWRWPALRSRSRGCDSSRPSSSEPRHSSDRLLNVPVVPGPPCLVHAAAVLNPKLKPVGTSRNTIVGTSDNAIVGTAALRTSGRPIPRTSLRASAPLVQTALTGAAVAIPLRETQIQSTAPSLDGLALSASPVALPADGKNKQNQRTSSAARGGRLGRGARIHARARAAGASWPRRSIHPSTIAGFGDHSRMSRRGGFSWPPGRVLFLIGTREHQRVVSW